MATRDPDRLVFDAGVKEGRQQARAELLGLLQKKQMDPKISRTSERYKALLELIHEFGQLR